MLIWLAAVLVVGLALMGWKVGRHLSATSWLESNHFRVIWGFDGKNWRSGGDTTVKYVTGYSFFTDDRAAINLKHLTWLHRVEELDLTSVPQITDDDLVVLDRLPSLRGLFLDRTKQRIPNPASSSFLTDQTLARIAKLKNLEHLTIGGQAITDAGLAQLKGLSQLTDIELPQTEITDAGLEHLKALPRLKSLDLSGTKVTPQAIKKLEAARPDLKIICDATYQFNL